MNTQSNHTQNPPTVCVENINLPIVVYQDTRVITTDLLAKVYGTEHKNIQNNFERNKARFQEGLHYFKLEGEQLTLFKRGSPQIPKNTKHLTLWTERGAARHAKMLDTDQAWDVFDKLEATYFEQPAAKPSQELPPSEPPTITKAQQGELYTRATRIAGGDKKKMTAIWSRLRTHYRINGYTNLPADQFQDALETLDRYKQEYNQGAEILHISTIELEAMLTERAQALPPPAKEGELLPNPTKDDLIGILTRQITALEAQLQAAQNLNPARMILALKQEGHLVIEKGQDLPGQIVMHYVSPKRLTQLIHCATERLENFLREEVANA
ncbi:ORF6N domain-containing protein [Methylovulum psychrotolerans]|uniref:KilA-N DNA-binding domain-containing protein n=1 Tax=Methylovulum psychrotolerans TaxID=1704499 RepID=A0A1Z4C3W8_9GAMM|nr:ORF6N domain-containing protein [Methylovulum psychrotolerans]ASF48198.1 hypothetical protein CEK71_20220 [Methylovulum psychrotolerans]